jgi:hypothetical protein
VRKYIRWNRSTIATARFSALGVGETLLLSGLPLLSGSESGDVTDCWIHDHRFQPAPQQRLPPGELIDEVLLGRRARPSSVSSRRVASLTLRTAFRLRIADSRLFAHAREQQRWRVCQVQ